MRPTPLIANRKVDTMKQQFTDSQIADFLRRSYFVVDGLWFVMTEEHRGFEEAMEQDEAVWQVMAKIQARKAKQQLGIDDGSLESLVKAFQLKLAAEGYDFEIGRQGEEFTLTISKCPWYEVLKATGRTAIAETIADRICATEFAGWIKEFSPDIEFSSLSRLCVQSDQCDACLVSFRESSKGVSSKQ